MDVHSLCQYDGKVNIKFWLGWLLSIKTGRRWPLQLEANKREDHVKDRLVALANSVANADTCKATNVDAEAAAVVRASAIAAHVISNVDVGGE